MEHKAALSGDNAPRLAPAGLAWRITRFMFCAQRTPCEEVAQATKEHLAPPCNLLALMLRASVEARAGAERWAQEQARDEGAALPVAQRTASLKSARAAWSA